MVARTVPLEQRSWRLVDGAVGWNVRSIAPNAPILPTSRSRHDPSLLEQVSCVSETEYSCDSVGWLPTGAVRTRSVSSPSSVPDGRASLCLAYQSH